MKIKKLWIKLVSIVLVFWANILLFYTPVKFKRFIFVNMYKIIIVSILIVIGILTYVILKFLL